MRQLLGVLVVSAVFLACNSPATSSYPSPPTPVMFANGEAALRVLKANSTGTMDGRCFTLPQGLGNHREGSTGALTCDRFRVEGYHGSWLLNVWTFDDDFYAESGYRDSCSGTTHTDRWWVIWDPGQNWFGEVSDDAIVFANEKATPAAIAGLIAEALGSQAWDDCSGVR